MKLPSLRGVFCGALAIGLGLGLLAGCAGTPVDSKTATNLPAAQEAVNPEALARARIHTELAAEYFSRGQYGVSLDELNQALRAYDNYGPAYNMLGLTYMELREDPLAVKSFERALKIGPNDSDANNNYGWFLCSRGKHAESIHYFMAAQRNPLYATPEKSFVNAGLCSRRMGDEAQAVEFFEKALKLKADEAQALFNLAEISFSRGDYGAARERVAKLLKSATTAEYLAFAMRIERRMGDRSAAASYAQQLKHRFPDSKEARELASENKP